MPEIIETPKVTLLSHTNLPLETVFSMWHASKDEKPLITPQQVKDTIDPEEVRKLFRAVIAQRIPIGESIGLVFMLEGISVSFREQAVRHRIGANPSPERLGSDHVCVETMPDKASSSFWSQSMRIQNMGNFAENGNFRIPETILKHPESERLLATYLDTMTLIEHSYNDLVDSGIPMEDARELIPLGATHRMSWALNLGSLQHIVSKRGCWVLQLGIWGPIITGMIKELTDKVDPIFAELVTPPCLDGDNFKGCVYHEEVRRRYSGDDKLPPCPLHFRHHHIAEHGGTSDEIKRASDPDIHQKFKVPRAAEMVERADQYEKFWNRDPWTGRRLRVISG